MILKLLAQNFHKDLLCQLIPQLSLTTLVRATTRFTFMIPSDWQRTYNLLQDAVNNSRTFEIQKSLTSPLNFRSLHSAFELKYLVSTALPNFFNETECERLRGGLDDIQHKDLIWFIQNERTVSEVRNHLTFAKRGIDNC